MLFHCSSFSLQCAVENYETYIASLICVSCLSEGPNDTCMNKLKDLLFENITSGRASFSSLKLKQYRKCNDHAKYIVTTKHKTSTSYSFYLFLDKSI